jgi:drug/metabolite transporter (DMT)-like permease
MRYRLALFASALLWSTSFPLIKYALRYSPPLTLLFYRFIFASITVLLIFRTTNLRKLLFSNLLIPLLGLFNSVGFILQFEGQAITTASKAALLVNLYVVFVAIIARIVLGEKLNRYKIVAIITALLGASLIATGWNPDIILRGNLKGDLLVLSAGLIWSFYIVFSKKVSPLSKPLEITGGVMIWTLIFLLIVVLPLKRAFVPSKETLFYALYLGIFCSVIPYFLYIYSLRRISASISALFLLLEVVLSLIWSWIFLGERFKGYEFLGAIAIILSIYLGGKEEVLE